MLPADRYSATATVIAKPADATDVASYSSAVTVLVPTLSAYLTSEANDTLVRGSLPPELADADVEIKRARRARDRPAHDHGQLGPAGRRRALRQCRLLRAAPQAGP